MPAMQSGRTWQQQHQTNKTAAHGSRRCRHGNSSDVTKCKQRGTARGGLRFKHSAAEASALPMIPAADTLVTWATVLM